MKAKQPENNCKDFRDRETELSLRDRGTELSLHDRETELSLLVHVLIKGKVNLLFVDFLNLQKYMRIVWLRLLFVSVSVVHLCVCMACVCWCSWIPEEGIISSGAEIRTLGNSLTG